MLDEKVRVRRTWKHGPAYLPEYGVTVQEGEEFDLPFDTVDGRPDWEIVSMQPAVPQNISSIGTLVKPKDAADDTLVNLDDPDDPE